MVRCLILRFLLLAALAAKAASAGDETPDAAWDAAAVVWLLTPDAPAQPGRFAAALRAGLAGRGTSVREVSAREWTAVAATRRGPGDILVVAPGASLPADGRAGLEAFLWRRNHLLNLSETAFARLAEPIVLETLSPAYKTYPTEATRIRWREGGVTFGAATPVRLPLPRSRGQGSAMVPPARFIPIAEAEEGTGRVVGAAAHLQLNAVGLYAGAVWGAVGLRAAEFEAAADSLVPLVLGMVARIQRGVFLADGGPEHPAYAAPAAVVGAVDLVNLGAAAQPVEVTIAVTRDGHVVQTWSDRVTLPAHALGAPRHVAAPAWSLAPGSYRVSVRVRQGDALVDEITGPLQVIDYAAAVDAAETVVVRDGEFVLAGRPWHPLGLNYWPHLAVGLEPRDFSRHWMSPDQYDPDLVERDLALAEQLGLNELSVQYTTIDQAPVLMDFLARAAHHRLKVAVYFPALEPLRPDPGLAQRMILAAHLPASPALFAYDVCWEGHLGLADERRVHDARWQDWVVARYGSVAAAEEDWHFSAPRANGVLAGPADAQLRQDGPWRVYVAAYRRFWDDEISRSYRRVRAVIREVDPVHLIGARSGYGGNGTPMFADRMPFDLASGARHLDFISPEGYALAGSREDFLKGGFTTAYARLVSGGKPVFWAEYGVPLRWQVEAARYVPVREPSELEPQRAYFHQMLQFVRETAAAGCSGWWWPGGYRVDEQSDFGVVNPDGSLRPAARELQLAAAAYAGPWPRPAADQAREIDRDRHVDGFAGLYTAGAEDYRAAFLAGHALALRTAGTGTTSVDTPAVAVGDVPWTGRNPPKYLNAEFGAVVVFAGGRWRPVKAGERVEVPAGRVRLRVDVTNTAEASWLPPSPERTTGGVVLEVGDTHGRRQTIPLPVAVPFLGDATFPEVDLEIEPGRETEVTLVLAAEKRTPFGERFHLRFSAGARTGP